MLDPDAPPHTDPAVIAAMSVCWLWQTQNAGSVIIARQVMDRHGEECRWCGYKPDLLMDYIEEWWRWVRDFSPRTATDFEHLPKSVQHDRVMAALRVEA